jgi:hypothetical protein
LLQQELTDEEKQLLKTTVAIFGPFTNLNDEISLRMELFQLGLKVGHRFFFRNPRFEFRLELAYSMNLYANTTTNYDRSLADRIVANNPSGDLGQRLDFEGRVKDVDAFFKDYGYIPTLNAGLCYLLFIPDKVKKEQEKLDLQKSAE